MAGSRSRRRRMSGWGDSTKKRFCCSTSFTCGPRYRRQGGAGDGWQGSEKEAGRTAGGQTQPPCNATHAGNLLALQQRASSPPTHLAVVLGAPPHKGADLGRQHVLGQAVEHRHNRAHLQADGHGGVEGVGGQLVLVNEPGKRCMCICVRLCVCKSFRGGGGGGPRQQMLAARDPGAAGSSGTGVGRERDAGCAGRTGGSVAGPAWVGGSSGNPSSQCASAAARSCSPAGAPRTSTPKPSTAQPPQPLSPPAAVPAHSGRDTGSATAMRKS
jgi:hypothetical protein